MDSTPVRVRLQDVEDGPIIVNIPRTTPQRRPVVDEDGWATCARTECGGRFNQINRGPSRCYCSDDCAILDFFKRQGMAPAKIAVRKESVVVNDNHGLVIRPVVSTVDADREALLVRRNGPMREITDEISQTRTAKRVRFDCGHSGTVPLAARRGRCRICAKTLKGDTMMINQPVQPKETNDAKPVRTPLVVEPPPTVNSAPSRKIVGFTTGRNPATRIALLECGHKRSVDMSTRHQVRCAACEREGNTGVIIEVKTKPTKEPRKTKAPARKAPARKAPARKPAKTPRRTKRGRK